MNSIPEIASAIAEGAGSLAPGQEVHVPLDDHRWVRVLRRAGLGSLALSVAILPVGRNDQEQAEAREALLRLGADSRFTQGFAGGLDAEGHECVLAELAEPVDAAAVEMTLQQMLDRLATASPPRISIASNDDSRLAPPDMAAHWLRV